MLARKPVRRIAPRRGGLRWQDKKLLDALSRRLTMLIAGAAVVEEDGREMWWGKCRRCPREGWLSWCHVFTRAIAATRWDPDNTFAWCSGCHRHLDLHWKQKERWVIHAIGQERFDAVERRARPGRRVDYGAVKLALEIEVGKLEGRAA